MVTSYLVILLLVLIIVGLLVFYFKFLSPNAKLNKQIEYIRTVSQNSSFIVPRKVHQIWFQGSDVIPALIKPVIKHNKDTNSNWTFYLYNKDDIDTYIRTHESSRVYNIYKRMNPKLFSGISDLFRYIILYHEGGVYLDIKCKMETPLDNWVDRNKISVSLNTFPGVLVNKYSNDKKRYLIETAGLIFPPKSSIIRLLIDDIISELEKYSNTNFLQHFLDNFTIRNYTNYTIYNKLGPIAVTKVLMNYIWNNSDVNIYYCTTAIHPKKYDGIVHKQTLYGLFDDNILFDGTEGKYYEYQSKKNTHWSKQKGVPLLLPK